MLRSASLVVALVALAAIARPTPAQALGTDFLAGSTSGRLIRMKVGQPPQTVGTYGTGLINMITMDNDNFHVVVIDTSSPRKLLRIDPTTGAVSATVWTGAPFGGLLSWIEVDQDGDYVVTDPGTASSPTRLLKVRANGGGVSTLYQGKATELFNAFVEDRMTGNWVIGDFTTKSLLTVDRGSGTVTTVIPVGTSALQGMVQDPQAPEIYVAANGTRAIVAYHPLTHTTTASALSAGLNSIAIDRAPANDGALIFGGGTSGILHKVTRGGAVVGNAGSIQANPFGFLLEKNRNVAPILQQAPNDRFVRISFPNAAQKPYGFALSATGYTPGLSIGGGRVIPLVPDAMFLLTAQGPVPPVLVNNAGILDNSGQAFVRFNVNPLGTSVQGVRLWGAAITFDPSAPLGIGEISAPVLFVL